MVLMKNIRLDEVFSGRENNYLLPFYWQHGSHTERIPEQVQRIYDSGARAFCVESRPHKDFCGPGWWRDMDVIIAEAKKRDMKVWILDDDHFPTGHANGAFEEKYPELRQWMAKEYHVDVVGPMADAAFLVKLKPEDEQLGAYALRRNNDEDQSCFGEAVNLTDNIRGSWLYWNVPEGVWRIFFYRKCRGGSRGAYADMINKDSVRVLIDEVYEPHWAHYADEFGKTIAGFFSDEPSFANGCEDRGRHQFYESYIGRWDMELPWNDRVREMMEETLGYDPLPNLQALWYENEKRPEMRFAYMDAVTRLYAECFTGQLADWCHAHGVEYIGHIVEDMHSHKRMGGSSGHFFRTLEAQDMSGIDVVLHQIIPGMNETIHRAAISNECADPEFFDYVLAKLGASLAHLTPHMKGRAMCEIFGAYGWAEDSVMQKRLMDHMLVRGINHYVPHAFSPDFPDNDCPPHFGAEGKDPSFEAFAALMKYTNQICHLLCGAQHVSGSAILYDAEGEWCSRCKTAMHMQKPAKALYDSHLDFDFVPMDILEKVSVQSGKMEINGEQFGCLIVPAADHLPEKLVNALGRLKSEGLAVLFVDVPAQNLGFDGEVVPLSGLTARVEELGLRDVALEGTHKFLRVYHARRDGSDMFFFVNESADCTADAWAVLPAAGRYARLDLLNDSCTGGNAPDGRVKLNLLPGQSQMIVFAENELPCEFEVRTAETLAPEFEIALAPCENLTAFEPWKTTKKLVNVTGPEGIADFSGKMRYRFNFEAETDGRLFMNLGRVGQNAQLKVNGEDCGIRICPPYRYEITGAVKAGCNCAEVIVANTLVQRVEDGFSVYLAVAPSGLLGPVTLETVK